jgi:hypothetical protein
MGLGLGTVLGGPLGVGIRLPVLRAVLRAGLSDLRRSPALGATASGVLVLLSAGQGVLPLRVAVPGALGAGGPHPAGLKPADGDASPHLGGAEKKYDLPSRVRKPPVQ